LRELERRFPDVLVVIGVHSGKYHAERVTARIREASLRLGVTHPVVNDRQFRVWRAYAVNAWPTLALIDPQGYVVGTQAGELTADDLTPAVARLVDAHATTLDRTPLPPWAHGVADAPAIAPGALRYPGKVALSRDGRRVAVADTGHHRVLLGALSDDGRRMRVERVVGRGAPTWATAGHAPQGVTRDAFARAADGTAEAASFDGPQGLTFDDDGARLYVADAGNHAVRVVDVATGHVRTLAGTGTRVRTRDDRREGALASPWDVALAGDTLVVAMAGTHQLWTIDLATNGARPHAGGRGEDIVDAPLADALLAQPMGLAADAAARAVSFADAESSAIRVADLDLGGAVRTLVGTGLFDFGDKDGVGDAASLQHPQAVARHPDGRLLVADAYNDALKWLDPAARRVTTWLRGLHEPAGVAIAPDGRLTYIADTNAHRVAVVNTLTPEVHDLEIAGL
jgi:DNA-binding beta-propeller fold protein YncE